MRGLLLALLVILTMLHVLLLALLFTLVPLHRLMVALLLSWSIAELFYLCQQY